VHDGNRPCLQLKKFRTSKKSFGNLDAESAKRRACVSSRLDAEACDFAGALAQTLNKGLRMSIQPSIISFAGAAEPQRSSPDAARKLAGDPQLTVWNHYSDATGQFFAGVWQATPGRWAVRYSEHEFCHLLAGRVVITSDAGERFEFTAGASFVVPAGFSGTWEVVEECRKVYAIFEARATATA
jgi:uncharacterized protein